MKRRHITLSLSAPIIFVLLLNQSGMSTSTVNAVALSSAHTRFVEVGDALQFSVDIQSLLPINAIGVSLSFPHSVIAIEEINRAHSLIDLWVEEPTYSNTAGTARLSGGLLEPAGYIGRGHIATLTFRALTPGKAPVTIGDAVLLARDGKGTNVLETKENITFIIREKGDPSPDINQDGVLSLLDAAMLYFATFRAYRPEFDLNKDTVVSFADVMVIGELIRA